MPQQTPPSTPPPQPPTLNIILSFLLVGLAWGFTTPFIRRAARDHQRRHHRSPSSSHAEHRLDSARQSKSRLARAVRRAAAAVLDLLINPRYAVPLVLNLTGSVWFFLLLGTAGTFFLFFFLLPSLVALV
ncbi:uncharacterized protein THITE_2109168 [Thermothielavioides terrestris NRRL 8126]|uniref:Transmembrane protein n=1 Tax=Thermothielavioides terrestris (strain ATCC 38088 / NRRL 8126) TaxID=578455 RepID=G2QTX4_THETT|nr:uncharacterized protein THITE_2109168 [Thermothielavioides terrestris NRRL 8126]AEO63633.1 hypothetical protein THITE_2109168 [Thermothielavioides terrestris NRRL 8126]